MADHRPLKGNVTEGDGRSRPPVQACAEPVPLLAFRLARGGGRLTHGDRLNDGGAGPTLRFAHGDDLAGACIAADLTGICHGYGLSIDEQFQGPTGRRFFFVASHKKLRRTGGSTYIQPIQAV